MKRSSFVTAPGVRIAGAVVVGALALSGCAAIDNHDTAAACVKDGVRVKDDECEKSPRSGGGAGAAWMFFRAGQSMPAVGSAATSGSSTLPKGASVQYGGSGSKGGTVKGGFGGKAPGGGHGIGG